MNKAYLTILFAQVLILSGCASLDSNGCPRVSTTLTAKDDGKSGSGGGATFIRVNPDTVKVAGSGDCFFVLNNPRGHLIHTTSATSWLNRPAQTKGNIRMGPTAGNEGDEFKYTIHVDKIGRLDPRVRVTY